MVKTIATETLNVPPKDDGGKKIISFEIQSIRFCNRKPVIPKNKINALTINKIADYVFFAGAEPPSNGH